MLNSHLKYRCEELKLPGYWRVDGISSVSSDANDPFVHIACSEIRKNNVLAPYGSRSTTGNTHVFKYPIRGLSYLTIGSVWHAGAKVGDPKALSEELVVDVKHLQIVSLEEEVSLNGSSCNSVLPESYISLGKNRGVLSINKKFAIMPVLGNPKIQWLITPCSEILRFYYGVSSRLLISTISGDLSHFAHWNKGFFEWEKFTFYSKLPLGKLETAVLARANASETASNNMMWTHKKLASTRANNNRPGINQSPLVIEALPPFNDVTKLQVRGKRIRIVEGHTRSEDQWGIYGMQLLSCSHYLGFLSLIVEHEEEKNMGKAIEGGDARQYSYTPRLTMDLSEIPIDSTTRPNKDVRPIIALSSEQRFTQLQGMKFKHNRTQGLGKVNKGKSLKSDVSSASLRDPSSSADSKNIGPLASHTQLAVAQREIEQFFKVLVELRKLTIADGCTITTIPVGESFAALGEFVSTFPPMSASRSWHLIENNESESPATKEHFRQVVIAQIKHITQGTYFYLLEMELAPGEKRGQCTIMINEKEFQEISPKVFSELLYLSAIQNRWIGIDNKWEKSDDWARARGWFKEHEVKRISHLKRNKEETENSFYVRWAEDLWEKIQPKIRAT